MDKDFSHVQFKVNVSGSWANLVYCHVDQYDQVKDACTALAKANRGSIRFKSVDAAGGTIEQYSPAPPNGSSEWHEPRIPGSRT